MGIEGGTDHKTSPLPKRLAGKRDAGVELLDHADHIEGGDVEDGTGAGKIAEARRIAGNDKDLMDTQGVKPHEVRLLADEVAVPACDVDKGIDAQAHLDDGPQGQIAHPRLGQGVVGHGDGVGPRILQRRRPDHVSLDIQVFRWVEFHEHRGAFFYRVRYGAGPHA